MKLFAIALVALAALAPPAFAVETTNETTAALFAEQYPVTRSVLAADFPQDLQALEQSFGDIDSTEISPQLKMQRAFLELTALRKQYASQLQFARADMSALVVLSLADFYQSVLQRDGAAVCGGFATDGAGALYTIGAAPGYALELDRQSAAYFSAVVSALEDPDAVGPASEEDWKQVMSQIVTDGHPPSYLASIAGGRATDPDLCPALSAFMHAMVDVKSDVALRARADFIQNATGY
ncbi:hypothetical protein [Devosia sp. UYZn731]|uniref:hypothetical protein n=1 Tax=Devosia sp. UYZn731 TaxID=3156345 RepID=UPI0033940401